ncbi:MAG: 4Fe-4S dicluster domain-containing protein [Anaerolineae bacterium]|nr:4Fe-4S dicluster domain-containing protein [Anaerolineae bacterium]
MADVLDLTTLDRSLAQQVTPGRWEEMLSCIQCGTCSASCPAAHAMDVSPRRMWRMVNLGLVDEIMHSKTMWLCSLCYQCQVRCPRGIPLTETITRLKEMAMERGLVRSRASAAFYRSFAYVMRHYGRMREMEFMMRFILSSNPLGALGYIKLGPILFLRGKVKLELPTFGKGRLDRLFERVAELEGRK